MAKKHYIIEWGIPPEKEIASKKIDRDKAKIRFVNPTIHPYMNLRGSDRLDYFIRKVREVSKSLEEGHWINLIDTETGKVLKRFVNEDGVVKEE